MTNPLSPSAALSTRTAHADGEWILAPQRAFAPDVFAARRAKIADALRAAGGGIAIIASAPVPVRSRDSEFPYRQDSSFFYLTGFAEPDALLVIDSRGRGTASQPVSTLFCREKDPLRETWEGFHYGPLAAQEAFGFDLALPNSARDGQLPDCLTGAAVLAYPLLTHGALEADIARWLREARGRRRVVTPGSILDLARIVEPMRQIKDPHEIDRMRTAGRISAQAHIRAMQTARVGMPEYVLEAELLYHFRRSGAQAPAYTSIVAGGANACTLHYPAGDYVLRDGDLVLIDAACELDGYASDITRTFPANGRFTGPQRTLYDIVLAANDAAITATRPGARFDDAHQAALRVLVQGMLDTGLLRANDHGSVEDVIADRAYSRFYMHSTGHWLGLDVHDCGDYVEAPTAATVDANGRPGPDADNVAQAPRSTLLTPGMVSTIEPGLYVRRADDVPSEYWDIGIRIEDNVVVTDAGCALLTRDVPVAADEIEALMRAA
ncbi:aminopeptidase P N-terminal domain-containing protein [Robbsia andropogonis]|uniref:aminopeptidase P N-terminal domain-containing protein n=1 Tax=Robbsia andropogonis TaxID=28092 RepID=UPI0004B5F801